MNLINELRMLAEDLYVNGYNRYSTAMSNAADEIAKWEAVFGHIGDTPDECGNAIIAARDELEERLEVSEAEALEQARLNGVLSEREACREILEDLIRTQAHLACNAREALSEASARIFKRGES